jgi:uncharacterized protein (TIGR03118 family)
MQHRLSRVARLPKALLAVSSLLAAGSLLPIGAAPARAATSGTVLQTNLVSDLPGAAAVTDPNLVNSWGISESSGSPFWISDNNAGLTTLYNVPGAGPVSINPLAVNIPTPVSFTGGAPTGTVFNTGSAGAFEITGPNNVGTTISASAAFLFATEDGTIVGWNPGIDPTGKFAGPAHFSEQAVIAKDNSGNNFTQPDPTLQTGAVYKGLAIATNSTTPIVSGDTNSTSLLYAANFRAGTIDVYGTDLKPVTGLSAGAFTDPGLPAGYAPFNVQVLDGKLYVSYAVVRTPCTSPPAPSASRTACSARSPRLRPDPPRERRNHSGFRRTRTSSSRMLSSWSRTPPVGRPSPPSSRTTRRSRPTPMLWSTPRRHSQTTR